MLDKTKQDDDDGLTKSEKEDKLILQEAYDNFDDARTWENPFQVLYVVDTKFANADSDNGWQWPDDLKADRTANRRPTLTINKVRTKVDLITNEGMQNEVSIRVSPTGKESSFESAQIYEGIIRHIESCSGALSIYNDAYVSAVEGGIGYWRIVTEYEDEESFNQVLRIAPVLDQMSVYLDPNIKKKDGSDAEYGFIFDELPRKRFERMHPNLNLSDETGFNEVETWVRDDYVRVAEYYRITKTKDELIFMDDGAGQSATFKRSDVPAKYRKGIEQAEKAGQEFKKRVIWNKQLEWYKIAGNKIIDRRKLKGKYIPIVRCVGIERVIESKLERKGHVRALKDPQRMYNYNSSGQVEYGALATKTPWVGPKKAFEGNEVAWAKANNSNAAFLTYNDWDPDRGDAGSPIEKPIRPEPPGASPAFVNGMQIAEKELDMASGQYQATEGRPGNERSGKAINARTTQGDTATFHFPYNRSLAVAHTGAILLDLIPYTYDTERIVQILGEDGIETTVTVDPEADEALQVKKDKDKVQAVFNPRVGKYQVKADVGPAYATQRQEAWNAFVQIVTGSPELLNDVGDLMFKSADFPLADEIAERLRRKIRAATPWLFDDQAPTPAQQQLKQELDTATKQVAELLEQLADTKRKLSAKDQRRDIEAYRAETSRVKDLANSVEDVMHQPGASALLVSSIVQTLRQMGTDDITDNVNAAQMERDGRKAMEEQPEAPAAEPVQEEEPPMEGARKAPDGNWYASDPARPGKYLKVNKE